MITTDGAGFSHKLLQHLDKLASRRGFTLIYSCGWELDQREKAAIRLVPQDAWQIAVDHRGEVRERRADDACADPGCGHRGCWIEEAHVTELTGLLRHRPDGDRLAGWPQMMRIFARRERPHPARNSRCSSTRTGTGTSCGSPTSPQAPEDGAASALTSTPRTASTPGSRTFRTGKDTGIGRFPSHGFAFNQAWLTAAMIAQILLAWLKLLALDGKLARAEPRTLRYQVLHAAARLVRGGRRRRWKIAATWPWAEAITQAWHRIRALPDPT